MWPEAGRKQGRGRQRLGRSMGFEDGEESVKGKAEAGKQMKREGEVGSG
jgi:hypothetical protein